MIHLLALASPKASNQSLEPTAGRRVTSLFMIKHLAASTLALASGGSALAR
jgi:hypothetical protein